MKTPLLESIKDISDLQALPPESLPQLAEEIREVIIRTTSRVGGHLASSLGVVELTIALHYCLDSPRDKLIWDVGHQSYAHKLLTGRFQDFDTLRTMGGLSGFPKRAESPHDIVETGHASTSISYALGLAIARDLAGEDYKVVAVIGDGALTGGLSYEALNQAGHLKKNLLIVLNDNGMAISQSVGALSTYLSQFSLYPNYRRMKEEVKSILHVVPWVGTRLEEWIAGFKERTKNFLIPEFIFEELGINYVGPLNGHNIDDMVKDIRLAVQAEGPHLLHVRTFKGKGYAPAERNPDYFHGTGPFDIATGKLTKKESKPSYTETFGRTLCEMAEEDERIVAITAAMTIGTGLVEFERRFPKRFFDVGIAEPHAVTLAAGMALGGLRPVVAIYSTFLQRAFDQLSQEICLQSLPVILAIDRAGLVGEDGPTHHGSFDLSYLGVLPNMTVMAPKDQAELRDMLVTARSLDGPCAIRYPRGSGPADLPEQSPQVLPVGKAEVLNSGSRVALVGLGQTVQYMSDAAELLSAYGIRPTVVNARFMKPLDRDLLLDLAGSHALLLTAEDNALRGGFGERVTSLVRDAGIPCDIICLGLPDNFVDHGDVQSLHRRLSMDASGIAAAVVARLATVAEGYEFPQA